MLGVNKATPIRSDTKVGLEFTGLTGIASVSLKLTQKNGTYTVSATFTPDTPGRYDILASAPYAGAENGSLKSETAS